MVWEFRFVFETPSVIYTDTDIVPCVQNETSETSQQILSESAQSRPDKQAGVRPLIVALLLLSLRTENIDLIHSQTPL
jgi:hypothetical protein